MSKTSQFYKKCWEKFGNSEQLEAVKLLSKRLALNSVSADVFRGKFCLDMGCGSARYSYALIALGATFVVGLDLEEPSLKNERFAFKQGSVLDLPFGDNAFGFVFCNGVLHHTADWKKGVREAFRVLEPGGYAWFYFCGSNRLWQAAEEFRELAHPKQAALFREHLELYSWEPNKIFFLMDSFFAPERVLLTKEECSEALQEAGFGEIRYLGNYHEKVPPFTHLRFLARKSIRFNL